MQSAMVGTPKSNQNTSTQSFKNPTKAKLPNLLKTKIMKIASSTYYTNEKKYAEKYVSLKGVPMF